MFSTRLLAPFLLLALVASLFAGLVTAFAHDKLATHMMAHISVMNVLAPLSALTLLSSLTVLQLGFFASRSLLAAALTQIAVLWALHSPALFTFTHSVGGALLFSQALLFCLAFWFWLAVFSQPPRDFWRASLALLMTGKLFCLLGALLVFAPRSLYPEMHIHLAGIPTVGTASQDQQLAGLLMLVACPFSYVLAGIILASRALRKLEMPTEELADRTVR